MTEARRSVARRAIASSLARYAISPWAPSAIQRRYRSRWPLCSAPTTPKSEKPLDLASAASASRRPTASASTPLMVAATPPEPGIRVTTQEGLEIELDGNSLGVEHSRSVFMRRGEISRIDVTIDPARLLP